MANFLEKKIQSSKLTKTERIVAEYIMNNLSTVCFMTATDIAIKTGTSDSSVIRLARTLGYRGYADMQHSLQVCLSQQANKETNRILAPIAQLSDDIPENANEHMRNLLDLTMKNLKSTIDNNPNGKIMELTNILVHSRNKHIFGSRVSSAAAIYFGTRLSHYIQNVFVSTTADTTVFERMMDTSEEDCVIIFTFERHTVISQAIAEAASKSNAKIIIITDNISSPLTQYADLLVLIADESINLFPSLLPFSFIAEVILASVYEKIGPDCEKRYRAAGNITKQLDKGKAQL